MKQILKRGAALLTLLCLLMTIAPAAFADDAPVITEDLPTTVSAVIGGEFTLKVTAAGESLSYQWYKNGVLQEGQTSAEYHESGLMAASDNTQYYCHVQNSFGSVTSATCTLIVIQKPVLTQDIGTTALTVNPGDTITLTAAASGYDLMIQWFCAASGGEYHVIQGQTGNTLSVTASMDYSDTDIYCQFTNEAGSVTSSRCHITLTGPTPTPSPTPGPPAITKNPVGESVEEGASAIFIARADGVTGYTWQFISPSGNETYDYNKLGNMFPGLGISGGDTDTLSLTNIPVELNGWKVACLFTGAGGTTVSEGAKIQVQETRSSLSIITQPVGGVMAMDEKPGFTLSIQASATNGGTLSYQWYSAATNSYSAMQPISGATNSSYRPEREEGTRYYCVSVTAAGSGGTVSEPVRSTIVSVTFTASTAHEHSYSDLWEYNDISHWHQCTCGDHSDEAFHDYKWTTVRAATKNADGEQEGVCTVCGFETVQPIPAGAQSDDAEQPEKAPAKRSSGTFWLILLGILAICVVAGAAYLIRKVMTEDDEDLEDDEEYDGEYEDEADEYGEYEEAESDEDKF